MYLQIINRAKAIGDGVAQISYGVGAVVSGANSTRGGGGGGGAEPGAVEALCAAGARCQDGAGRLLYTAKVCEARQVVSDVNVS